MANKKKEFYYLSFAMLLLKVIDQNFDYYERKYLFNNHYSQCPL